MWYELEIDNPNDEKYARIDFDSPDDEIYIIPFPNINVEI